MTMPPQKPGHSKQDYETPPDFIEAVVNRFGPLHFDLAADADNAKSESFYTEKDNALAQDWTKLSGNLWLNPPFANIDPWAQKCAMTLHAVQRAPARLHRHDFRILLLTPASIGSNWFCDWVHGRALVLGLAPRLTFVGETQAYPKDLSLSVYGEPPRFDIWQWQPRRAHR